MKDVKAQSGTMIAIMSIALLAIDVVGLIVLCGATFLTGRPFLKMFQEMDMQLSGATQMLLLIPPAAYVGVFLLLIIFLVLKEILIPAKTVTLMINLVVGWGAVAYLIVYVTALFLPMIELMTNMQGP